MKIKYYFSKLLKKILNIPAIKNSKIDKTSKICSGTNVLNSCLGRCSYIGNYCQVYNAKIGNFCSIGDYCYIGGAEHPIHWVATSPVFHSGKNILKKNYSDHALGAHNQTIIGNDVWIGSMCLIKAGVRIGNGAVIGMGSVVTKDVDSYCVVAGNPAGLIRKRFSDDQISKLEKSEWWNFSEKELKEISPLIVDVKTFIKEVEKTEH